MKLASLSLLLAAILPAACASFTTSDQVVDGTGVIAGVVEYDGAAPDARWIQLAEGDRAHGAPERVRDESWVVAKDGGVANCVVTLEPLGDTPRVEAQVPDEPIAFAYVDAEARFVPHVLAVPAGATVAFDAADSDCALFHTYSKRNPGVNVKVPRGERREVVLAKPEVIRVVHDLRPWAGGTIAVVDEPFYAVTGVDGAFRFDGLAPGRYRLELWHERGGTSKSTLEVQAGQVVRIELSIDERR